MNRCPITYLPCDKGDYSLQGIQLLSRKLSDLTPFPYKQSDQLELALEFADKLSIQGVQPKLSAQFDEEKGTFQPVQRNGNFILKLQHRIYSELPQNEDLTMRLAKTVGIETPFHGMVYAIDGSLLYFIQRFDRQSTARHFGQVVAKKKRKEILHKTSTEDFAQLASLSRDTKYDFSMEKLVPIIETYCTFPLTEKQKLFLLTLFSFLIGNEDLHLKNFSMIRHGDLTQLSPAYDLVNSTIIVKTSEELALPLRGKKSNLTSEDLVTYYGRERLQLSQTIVKEILEKIESQLPFWKEMIGISFLSEPKKEAYLKVLDSRSKRLFP